METLDKKTILITSKKYALDAYDFLKSLFIAAGTPIALVISEKMDAWLVNGGNSEFPILSIKQLIMIGVAAGVTYLAKNFTTPAKQIIQLQDIPVTDAKVILKEEIKKDENESNTQ